MRKHKRPKCARPTCSAIPAVAEIAKQESIRFKINDIVDKLQGSTDPCSRFVRAGDPSPYHSLNEGPESLKLSSASHRQSPLCRLGKTSNERIAESFAGQINESVQE